MQKQKPCGGVAIFTDISPRMLRAWLAQNAPGVALHSREPIAAGIENTNYLVRGEDGKQYIFTVFELWDQEAAAYYMDLARHFAAKKMPVSQPLTDSAREKSGATAIADKPAALMTFIPGDWIKNPGVEECEKAAALLARFHGAAESFKPRRPNPRGRAWRVEMLPQVKNKMPPAAAALAARADEMDEELTQAQPHLPAAACHCDFFRNNVLWQDGKISGVIDFYFGGDDALIFDLAVCLCDWAFDYERGDFVEEKFAAILRGYESQRPMSDAERENLPRALAAAAYRFWLSRLYDFHFPRRAQTLTAHNPDEFESILAAALQKGGALCRPPQGKGELKWA